MRARSLHVHGRTFSEPRSPLADSEGRMPGERATGVCFFGDFSLHKQRKVTRSATGRVEALHFGNNSERLDSGFRRNDELRRKAGFRLDQLRC
jgi:hypothetical protein